MPTLVSSYSSTATATVTTRWWLGGIGASPAFCEPYVANMTFSDRREQGIFYPLGATRPIVVDGDYYGDTFSIDCAFATATEYAKLQTVRSTGGLQILRSPWGENWYVAIVGERNVSLEPLDMPVTYSGADSRWYTVALTCTQIRDELT